MDESEPAQEVISLPVDFFPLPQIREKQAKALDFFKRMVDRGITDTVIAAPTGVGKSAIGAAISFWAGRGGTGIQGAPGAYYLCTQKLLQDQLEGDIAKYPLELQSACSLKTAAEYGCPDHMDCGTGLLNARPPCSQVKSKTCTYMQQKAMFELSELAITNYPYFFTERTYINKFPQRKVAILDECHTLENQVLKFVELVIGVPELEKYAALTKVPNLPTVERFLVWLEKNYLARLMNRISMFNPEAEQLDPKRAREYQDLMTHTGKVKAYINDVSEFPQDWLYWQEPDKENRTQSVAKPIHASRFFKKLIEGSATVRVYMSAYPGPKSVFCRSLGLDEDQVAMLTLGSVFPKEHRPIYAAFVGSMSKRNIETTLPSMLRAVGKAMEIHSQEKGIIHCNSYALGEAIFRYFQNRPESDRLLFPRKAEERENVYRQHQKLKAPTVILSPSFTEGFDFADDLARWQVIGKVPYPYLGDQQVAAKKEQDPEWYAMKTVGTIVQASGRICRNEKDYGTTYIFDSDFQLLWDRYDYMFPNWWKEALIWHDKTP